MSFLRELTYPERSMALYSLKLAKKYLISIQQTQVKLITAGQYYFQSKNLSESYHINQTMESLYSSKNQINK